MFPNSLRGKGIWIRRIAACEQGNLDAIVARAQAAGFSYVILKVADGAEAYNAQAATAFDLATELTYRLRSAGVAVWGWHTLYGDKPRFKGVFQENYHRLEAACARQRLAQLIPAGVQGYVLHPEGDYQRIPGRSQKAAEFMDALRAAPELAHFPVGLSARKFPVVHRSFPWHAFRDQCDVDLPPIFWIGKRGEGPSQLEASFRQFYELDPKLPYAPVGPAFCEEDGCPSPEELVAFFEKALALGLPGVSLWTWDDLSAASEEAAERDLRRCWQALAEFTWLVVRASEPQEEALTVAPQVDETPVWLLSPDEKDACAEPAPEAEVVTFLDAETQDDLPEPLAWLDQLETGAALEPEVGSLSFAPPGEVSEEQPALEAEPASFDAETEGESLIWQAVLDQLESEATLEPEAEVSVAAPEDSEEQFFAGEPEVEAVPEAEVVALLPEADEDEPPLLRAPDLPEVLAEIGPTLPRPAALAISAPPHPHSVVVGRFFKALRTGKIAEALTLYAPGFVHVTRERVAHDTAAVYEFYQSLLQRLDSKTLAVLAVYGDRNAVHIEWSARTTEGESILGRDVFHLNRLGRIVYHHTDFRFTLP